MSEKPILFSGEMVRAILDGRKTQTRQIIRFPKRLYKPDVSWIASINPDGEGDWVAWGPTAVSDDFSRKAYPHGGGFKCRYGKVGDLLWVRETWGLLWADAEIFRQDGCTPGQTDGWGIDCLYRADGESELVERWRRSIFMPRWACRTLLPVTAVGVERLHDISEEDAIAEGFDSREAFVAGWDTINEKRGDGWKHNQWVWVVGLGETS